MTSKFNIGLLLTALLFASCYNFKGITIPNEMTTYKVENFTLTNANTPIDLDQEFTERLRRKIREESKLVNTTGEADVTYSGQIKSYRITYVAPSEENTTSLNRLEIGLKVEFKNSINEDDSWTKSYSDFEDFDATADFQSLQDGLIDDIIEDIVERIFNDSFTNW